MKTVSKINQVLCKVEGFIMVAWFALVIVVMTLQVISRYVFGSPIKWSEEFARYSFVWISYLGCAYCVGADGHTSITALKERLSEKGQKVLTIVGNVIMIGVFLRLMPIAIEYIAKNGDFLTSIMRIPFKYLYYSLPVGIGLSIIQLVMKVILVFDHSVATNA
ncbi:MAG: TRAP transporter small permease [Lachnospiraceae bacterium]|nr:TRAP transporter small permease [Lachnospiraceae bacterium]